MVESPNMIRVRLEDGFLLATPEEVRRVPSPIAGKLREAEIVQGADTDTEGRLFHVILASGAVPHAVFLRGSAPHADAQDVEGAIARVVEACGSSALAVVEDEGIGWAKVAREDSKEPEDTAAAVAAVKHRWGWDGSNPMDIVVGEARFLVRLTTSGGELDADVSVHPHPVGREELPKDVRQQIRDRARRGRSEFPPPPGTDPDAVSRERLLRDLARTCYVLPLVAGKDEILALRLDGEVVVYVLDEAHQARSEKRPPVPRRFLDDEARRQALNAATERFPFLAEIVS